MYASRFNQDDFDDKKTATIGAKLIAAADSLEIKMHRDTDGKVMMHYELTGTFGQPETEDDFPRVEDGEAKTTARALLKAFLGRG